jgi:hypothetical protein
MDEIIDDMINEKKMEMVNERINLRRMINQKKHDLNL